MGLTSITIENFKGIGAPVTVPLRPITLLFGANSAGKSTVIQALQYAWEVLENRNPDVDRTRLGGEAVDLGGFKNLVHQHDLDNNIAITLHYAGPPKVERYVPSGSYLSYAFGGLTDGSKLNLCNYLDILSVTVRLTTGWDYGDRKTVIKSYEVSVNGHYFSRIEPDDKGGNQVYLDLAHPFFSQETYFNVGDFFHVLLSASHYFIGYDYQYPDGVDEEGDPFYESHLPSYKAESIIPKWGEPFPLGPSECIGGSMYEPQDEPAVYEELVSLLGQIINGAGEAVLEELRGLRYLGPLREVPDRMQKAPLMPSRERWANGLGAWDALLRKVPWDEEGPFLVDKCSDYLHGTLGMQYTLRREDRIQLPADGEVFSMLRVLAAHFEECEEDDLQRLVDKIEHLESIPVVQLHDEKNDIDVAPMDIGVGISQALPVVVGAVEPNCTIFAVEQPELHIHPAVQSKIGDVLLREVLDPSKAGNRIFLIETHSEHLILRILRRIRESNNGRLPAGFPEVGPGDVQVIYVKQGDEGAELHLLDITPDGDFINDWPDGFFTEREEELF